MNIFFIYNPKSGKGKIKEYLHDIIDAFSKANHTLCIYATQSANDAIEVVKKLKASQYDMIVCSGGDGTIAQVAYGLYQSKEKIAVGYIPTGSTNDFAKTMGISMDILSAVNNIIEGKIIQIDEGLFNDQIFIYVAAFGIFSDVAYQTDQQLKNSLGYLAYVLQGIKSLQEIKAYTMNIEADRIQLEGEFIYGMISNSYFVGGSDLLLYQNVELDDGLLDVVFVEFPKNIIQLQEIVHAILTKKPHQNIHIFKTANLKITCNQKVLWTLDGECGGSHDHVVIQNLKKQVAIVVKQ